MLATGLAADSHFDLIARWTVADKAYEGRLEDVVCPGKSLLVLALLTLATRAADLPPLSHGLTPIADLKPALALRLADLDGNCTTWPNSRAYWFWSISGQAGASVPARNAFPGTRQLALPEAWAHGPGGGCG